MRQIILLFLFLAITLTSNAQQVRFGIVGGINLNKTKGDFIYSPPFKLGYRLGGTMIYNFSEEQNSWYLSSSALLSQKGYNLEWTNEEPKAEDFKIFKVKNNITYLQIPIVVGKNFQVSDNLEVFIEGGLFGAYALSGSLELEVNGKQTDEAIRSFEYRNRFDTGSSVGIGVNIDRNIRCSIGYEHGLLNLSKQDKTNKNKFRPKHFERSLHLSVAYIF